MLVEQKSRDADCRIFGIVLDVKSELSTHSDHDGIFVQDLTLDALQTFATCVVDDDFHQIPA